MTSLQTSSDEGTVKRTLGALNQALWLLAGGIAGLLSPLSAGAEEAGTAEKEVLSVPFAFYNEAFGAAGGYVYGLSGYPEPQSKLLATGMVGTQGSAMLFVAGQDLRLPQGWDLRSDRLFFDPIVSLGYFNEIDSYVDGNPKFPNEQAGANDSDEDNFITGEGWDNFFRLRMKYLLPIGHGRDEVVPRYELEKGILVSGASGATSLNPLESGRSFVELRPFYRSQEIDGDTGRQELRTNGVDVSYFWDNRDYPNNPSRGQALQLRLSHDFGWFDSQDSWSVAQLEYDQYFSFGANDTFRQRVLALNFWTADSLSWDESASGQIDHRPPAYTGATLGGFGRCAPIRRSGSTTERAFTTPPNCG